jgi:hypothetical protein
MSAGLVCALLAGLAHGQAYVGTAFTYQGELANAGAPANGPFDMRVTPWDDAGPVGSAQCFDGVAVSGGKFKIVLDFGPIFDSQVRSLQFQVRSDAIAGNCASGDYQELSPRQVITPAPFALALPGLRTRNDFPNPSILGGSRVNSVSIGAQGATISGGGNEEEPNQVFHDFGVVGGGIGNTAGPTPGTVPDPGGFATIGGGLRNTAIGAISTIGGGRDNLASGIVTTIGGGVSNTANNDHSTVGGGIGNIASGVNSVVAGGSGNEASAVMSTVAGGNVNEASGSQSTVGGGTNNIASAVHSTVAGGSDNQSTGFGSVVSGGKANRGLADVTTIAGGVGNQALGVGATVGGGNTNIAGVATAGIEYATIAGGLANRATGYGTTVAGGTRNQSTGVLAVIAGGRDSIAAGDVSAIGGGADNRASALQATVSGGLNNRATGISSTITGGAGNLASGVNSVVSGVNNTASGQNSSVTGGAANVSSGAGSTSGGQFNQASGDLSTIPGGDSNTAAGLAATVSGGQFNTAGGSHSMAGGRRAKVRTAAQVGGGDTNGDEGTFVWADSQDFDFTSTGPNQFIIRAQNGVAINTPAPAGFALAVAGSAAKTGGGSWATYSDERCKRDIRPMTGTLDMVLSLHGYTFEYKPEFVTTGMGLPGTQRGLLAQEVREVFPDWVGSNDQGYLHVTERSTMALMVESLRDLRSEKDREIASLREENQALKARLERIETMLGTSGSP